MMAEAAEKVYCVPCCAQCEDKCFAHTTLHCDLSREALGPHAHVMHVRDADNTSQGPTDVP